MDDQPRDEQRDDRALQSESWAASASAVPPAARPRYRSYPVEKIAPRHAPARLNRLIPALIGVGGALAAIGLIAGFTLGLLMLVRRQPVEPAYADAPTEPIVTPQIMLPSPLPAATLPPGPAPSPTSLLPPDYFLALSATPAQESPTPPPTTATPAIPVGFFQPAPTSAFLTAAPVFNLWQTTIVYVCYYESDEICTMRADGADQRRLTDEPGTDWYPSLSPDGEKIVFSSQRAGEFEIYVMELDGTDPVRLTRNHGSNYAPSFSPDMGRIVFTSTYGSDNNLQNIWIMNADGSNLRQLTDTDYNSIDPEWSPDGALISFSSDRPGTGKTELFIMEPDGSNVRQITDGADLGGRNDWSPDGRLMAFYSGPQGDKDIYVIDAACAYLPRGCIAAPVRLTDGGNNKGPSFSPDGQWIAFASQIDGDNEVFIIRIDGSDIRQLTQRPLADWQPRWRR